MDSLTQPSCIVVYIVCNPAPRGSPFELSLGLCSNSRVLSIPLPLRVSHVVVCPRFALGHLTRIISNQWYVPCSLYQTCLVCDTSDYYQHTLWLTITGIYYQCLLLVANIGDNDRYIPWVSITGTYHQWPSLVYTTSIYTMGIYYIYYQSTGNYYWWPLLVYTTMFITSDYY